MSNEYRPGAETGGKGADSGTRGPGSATGGREKLFEVFSARRRRWLLAFLHTASTDVVRVDDAVAQLECWERAVGEAGAGLDRRIETALHHTHLPKLVDAGLVEYDDRSGVVRYAGGQQVEPFLSLVETPA
ncbi:hypothetical protein ACKVMT_08155 [Halobacteriales archaeon Cl-PHB]